MTTQHSVVVSLMKYAPAILFGGIIPGTPMDMSFWLLVLLSAVALTLHDKVIKDEVIKALPHTP